MLGIESWNVTRVQEIVKVEYYGLVKSAELGQGQISSPGIGWGWSEELHQSHLLVVFSFWQYITSDKDDVTSKAMYSGFYTVTSKDRGVGWSQLEWSQLKTLVRMNTGFYVLILLQVTVQPFAIKAELNRFNKKKSASSLDPE